MICVKSHLRALQKFKRAFQDKRSADLLASWKIDPHMLLHWPIGLDRILERYAHARSVRLLELSLSLR